MLLAARLRGYAVGRRRWQPIRPPWTRAGPGRRAISTTEPRSRSEGGVPSRAPTPAVSVADPTRPPARSWLAAAVDSAPNPRLRVAGLVAAITGLGLAVWAWRGGPDASPHHAAAAPGAALALWRAVISAVRRGAADAMGHPGSGSDPAAAVAALLADVAAAERQRGALAAAAGGQVLDWLLRTAAGGGTVGGGEPLPRARAESSRALSHLLASDDSAKRVLSRPGAIPCLGAAVSRPGGTAAGEALAGALARVRGQAPSLVTPPYLTSGARAEDITAAVTCLQRGMGGASPPERALAAWALGQWAAASPDDCQAVVNAAAPAALVAAASESQGGVAGRAVQLESCGALEAIAAQQGGGTVNATDWSAPLVQAGAEAAANDDVVLASAAVRALAAGMAKTGEPHGAAGAALRAGALPLLSRLAAPSPPSPLAVDAVSRALEALVTAQYHTLGVGERTEWGRRLLDWCCPLGGGSGVPVVAVEGIKASGETRGGMMGDGGHPFGGGAPARALAALASQPDAVGAALAYTWLGRLLLSMAPTPPSSAPLSYPPPPPGTTVSNSDSAMEAAAAAQALAAAAGLAAVAAALDRSPSAAGAALERAGLLSPSSRDAYPAASRAVDAALAAAAVAKGLKALAVLACDSPTRQEALFTSGALRLLRPLLVSSAPPGATDVTKGGKEGKAVVTMTPSTVPVTVVGVSPGGEVVNPSVAEAAPSVPPSPLPSTPSPSIPPPAVGTWWAWGAKWWPWTGRPGSAAARGLDVSHLGSLPTGTPVTDSAGAGGWLRVPPTAVTQRQAARLLALLALHPGAARAIVGDDALLDWLNRAVKCPDRKLASHAKRALLHAHAHSPPGEGVGGERDAGGSMGGGGASTDPLAAPGWLPWWWSFAPTVATHAGSHPPPHPPRIIPDGLHLLSPGDPHHEAAVGGPSTGGEPPAVDIVFIHGIRGGPFATWRPADAVDAAGAACWPADWLAADLPQARLLAVAYTTRLTNWGGASQPLEAIAAALLPKLVTAGVGDRPVIFVAHSLGGLVVKTLLATAVGAPPGGDATRVAAATAGVVFFSCPHAGSWLADVPWGLGRVLRVAPAVYDIQSNHPALAELNRRFRAVAPPVLSFAESASTALIGPPPIPKLEVVPVESAWPGYGELVLLPGTDHITVCKPVSRNDPAYRKTLQFLRQVSPPAGHAPAATASSTAADDVLAAIPHLPRRVLSSTADGRGGKVVQ